MKKSSRLSLIICFLTSIPSFAKAQPDVVYTSADKKLFEDACAKGGLVGCNELGTMEIDKGHRAEARRLFTKACNDGVYLTGCSNLATLEKQDGHKGAAVKLFKMACDGNLMTACFKLGLLQIELGNYSDARKLLNKSCESGNDNACSSLEHMANAGK